MKSNGRFYDFFVFFSEGGVGGGGRAGVGDKPPPQQAPTVMRPLSSAADLDDLIHLPGPLTEDAVLKCLQARFCASQLFVSNTFHFLI